MIIFQNLIIGMPKEALINIGNIIEKEFRLLGSAAFEVLGVFTQALQSKMI